MILCACAFIFSAAQMPQSPEVNPAKISGRREWANGF